MTAFIVQISLGDTPQGTIEYKTIFAASAAPSRIYQSVYQFFPRYTEILRHQTLPGSTSLLGWNGSRCQLSASVARTADIEPDITRGMVSFDEKIR